MRLSYKIILASIPVVALSSCAGSGAGSGVPIDLGDRGSQIITIHTAFDDTAVAFQDGNNAWIKLAHGADAHTFTHAVTAHGTKYGVALLHQSSNAVHMYHLTTSDATTFNEVPFTHSDLSGPEDCNYDTTVTTGGGWAVTLGNDTGNAVEYAGGGTLSGHFKMKTSGDFISLVMRPDAVPHTDRVLDSGQIFTMRNASPAGGTLVVGRNKPGFQKMQSYPVGGGILAAMYYATPNNRAWVNLPRYGTGTGPTDTWSFLAPAATSIPSGDRLVLHHRESQATGDVRNNADTYSVITDPTAATGVPIFPTHIGFTSAKPLATDPSVIEVKFNAPAGANAYQFAWDNIDYSVSPAYLGTSGPVTIDTPTLKGVNVFKQYFTGRFVPTQHILISANYHVGSFLNALTVWMPTLAEPILSGFGPNARFAAVSYRTDVPSM